MISEIFALIQAGRSVAAKISAVENYINGKDFMDVLSELDINAAKEALERAGVSDSPREHLLSARNHVQSGISKIRSKMDGVVHSRIAFLNYFNDLIDAFYLHAILNFALVDHSSLSFTLNQIKCLSLKGEKWTPREPTLAAYSDVFIEMPNLAVKKVFGKARKKELITADDFCKQMRDSFYHILVEEREVDFVQYEEEIYNRVKLHLDIGHIDVNTVSVYLDGKLIRPYNASYRTFNATTSIGTHELLVICGNLRPIERDRRSNLFYKLKFYAEGSYNIAFTGKYTHCYMINIKKQ